MMNEQPPFSSVVDGLHSEQLPDDILKQDLEKFLDAPGAVSLQVWHWLTREGHVDRVRSQEKDVAWLADRVRAFCEAAGRPLYRPKKSGVVPETGASLADQVAARAILQALEAATRGEVEWFRKEHLKGRLLKPEEVEGWIRKQAEVDGRPTLYLKVPMPAGTKIEMRDKQLVAVPGFPANPVVLGGSGEALAYAVPEDQWVRRIPTAYGGLLDKLRAIASRLRRITIGIWLWIGIHADRADTIRRSSVIDCTWRTWPCDARYRCRDRFSERTGANLRQNHERATARTRIRAMSEKHIRLAVFCAERPDKEWPDRLQEWNETYPRWRYRNAIHFRRDCLQAQRRLVTPAFSVVDVLERRFGEEIAPIRKRAKKAKRASRKAGKRRIVCESPLGARGPALDSLLMGEPG